MLRTSFFSKKICKTSYEKKKLKDKISPVPILCVYCTGSIVSNTFSMCASYVPSESHFGLTENFSPLGKNHILNCSSVHRFVVV